jgi:DNA-directed RNA polymerase specialized sigma subunit
MDIEKFLKDSLNIEKEAWATAEAIQSLVVRENAEALIEEYAQDLTYMEEAAITAAKMVRALPDENTRRVFAARYLHKMTWQEAADATYLSITHVQRLHKKGIKWLGENCRF